MGGSPWLCQLLPGVVPHHYLSAHESPSLVTPAWGQSFTKVLGPCPVPSRYSQGFWGPPCRPSLVPQEQTLQEPQRRRHGCTCTAAGGSILTATNQPVLPTGHFPLALSTGDGAPRSAGDRGLNVSSFTPVPLFTCWSLSPELSLPLDGDARSPLSLSYCSEGRPKTKAQLPLPQTRSPPPFYLCGLRTWYLLVELKGISATLGFFSLISFTELYDCSMNLRRADSEASPVVSRCQDGVCTVSTRGTAQGEGCDGEDLGAIPERQERDCGGRGWARPDPEASAAPTGLIP